MRTIRASEISTFLFCQRAWMYGNQGVRSENMVKMALGTEIHVEHGRAVMAAGLLRFLAFGLLLAALILAAIHFTIQII